MSKVNDIQTAMWLEEDFLDLSPHAKLVYLWSFTNAACGMAGVYRVAERVIPFQTGLDADDVASALVELDEARFATYRDGAMFVRTRVKHLRTKTEQVAKSIRSDLALLQENHPLYQAFMDEYGDDQKWGSGVLHRTLTGTSTEGQVNLTRGSAEDHVSDKGKGKGKGKGKEGGVGETMPVVEDALPADLPAHLYAGALAAHAALTRLAAAKPAARPVTLAAVGRAVSAFPTHDHAQIAGDVEHWWVHGQGSTKSVKDVVQTYRNRLSSLPAPPAAATVHHLPESDEQRRARRSREIAEINRRAAARAGMTE